MASAWQNGRVRVFDTATGRALGQWLGDERGTWVVDYSPDNRNLITGGEEGVLKVWELATGRLIRSWPAHAGRIIPISFSPDGSKIVTGGEDRIMRVWDAADGRELLAIRGHLGELWDVNFSPDGRRLVSAALDKTVRVWDASNGRELLNLRGQPDFLMTAAFSPDGTRLASGGDAPAFEIWESATEAELVKWRQQEAEATARWTDWDRQALGTRRERPTASHSIHPWLILGPMPADETLSPVRQLRRESVPDEAKLRPRPGALMHLGTNQWHWNAASFASGLIDFNRHFGPGDFHYQCAYAVCYVRSKVEHNDVRLQIASSDFTRLYWNGEPIYENYRITGTHAVDSTDAITVRAGVNVIVFKMINRLYSWWGIVGIVDERGQPVQGLEFTLDPEVPALPADL